MATDRIARHVLTAACRRCAEGSKALGWLNEAGWRWQDATGGDAELIPPGRLERTGHAEADWTCWTFILRCEKRVLIWRRESLDDLVSAALADAAGREGAA